MLPPEPRLPLAKPLVKRGYYFVIHAPRQTGKTTFIRTLAQSFTESGNYAALVFSCEAGRAAGDDYGAAQRGILEDLRQRATSLLPTELRPPTFDEAPEAGLLRAAFAQWARACPRPLVLFMDEIDALAGQTLISVLSQIRAGYDDRPAHFPASIVLCGMRDVRDYKAASGGDPGKYNLGTSSPFNIKSESFRLGDFTQDDVHDLYAQHTKDTGQPFTEEAAERAFAYTQGQPWLVNALAREVVDKMGIDAPTPITPEHIDLAKERLIVARATHLDSLAARLAEPRVRNIIQPLLAGDLPQSDSIYDDDVSYVRDLGLIAESNPIAIANPIYHEVIPRVLGSRVQNVITANPRSFVRPDGGLDFPRLLHEFAGFWREHGEVLGQAEYHEVAPQIVLMAYLHRLVNGGGCITREYGVGRGRIDLLIEWPCRDGDGKPSKQREATEIKVWRVNRPDPLADGLRQIDEYLDRLGLDKGTLVIFDRRPEAAPLPERVVFEKSRTASAREIVVLRA